MKRLLHRTGVVILTAIAVVTGTAWAANFVFPLAVLQEARVVPDGRLRGVHWLARIPPSEHSARIVYILIREQIVSVSCYIRHRQGLDEWHSVRDALEPLVRWSSGGANYRTGYVGQYESSSHYTIELPVWGIFLLSAPYPVVALVRGPLRRRYRRKHGLCLTCGYSLRGLTVPRCPECGTATSDSDGKITATPRA